MNTFPAEFVIKDNVLVKYTGNASHVAVPSGLKAIGPCAFHSNTTIQSLELPEGLKRIEKSAFSHCRFLRQVQFPDSLTVVDAYAFVGCISLESLHLPRGVERIDYYAFLGCTRLNRLNLPEDTTVLAAFSRCPLSQVDFGSRTDFSNIADGRLRLLANRCIICGSPMELTPHDPEDEDHVGSPGMHCPHCHLDFSWEGLDCWDHFYIRDSVLLEHIYCGGMIPPGVTAIGSWAFDDETLPELHIPDTVTEIGPGAFNWCDFALWLHLPAGLRKLEQQALCGCNLSRIYLPNGLRIVDKWALAECHNLKELVFPDHVKQIGMCAVEKCESLSRVELNDGLRFLGSNAFRGCVSLRQITIPRSVLSIEKGCFYGCDSLRKVRMPSHLKELELNDIFDSVPEIQFY